MPKEAGLTIASQDAKKLAIEVIGRLPDDVTIDDIVATLDFVAKVERGLRDIDEGRVVSDEEARKEFADWLAPDDSKVDNE